MKTDTHTEITRWQAVLPPRARRLLISLVLVIASVLTVNLASATAAPAPTRVTTATPSMQMSGEFVVKQWSVGGATVQLWYNNGWNWVSVSGAGGRGAEAGVYSAPSGWRWSTSYGYAPSRFTTPAVWAPGSTCVYVYANVVSSWWPYYRQTLYTQVC